MTYLAIRLDDYLLDKSQSKQFERISKMLLEREMQFTVGVVAGNYNESIEQIQFLTTVVERGNEVAIHGYTHSNAHEGYEFENDFLEQKEMLEKSFKQLARYFSPTITIIPPYYRGNQTTIDVMHQLAAEWQRKFSISAYFPNREKNIDWETDIFIVNKAIDIISDWKNPERPISSPREIFNQISVGDNCLVIHPHEHKTADRVAKLEQILDCISDAKIMPMSLYQLSEVYKNGY